MIYVKHPFDYILLALADLGWIPRSWAEWGEGAFKHLRFSGADQATFTKFLKFFEQFGEAGPQLVIAVLFFMNHIFADDTSWEEDKWLFGYFKLPIPVTLLSIFFSCLSITVGLITGFIAGREVCAAKVNKTTPLM